VVDSPSPKPTTANQDRGEVKDRYGELERGGVNGSR
jgi:hypothetical protein